MPISPEDLATYSDDRLRLSLETVEAEIDASLRRPSGHFERASEVPDVEERIRKVLSKDLGALLAEKRRRVILSGNVS